MAIDNFEAVKAIMTPLAPGDYYFIQVRKRRKEHPDLKSNSKWVRSYYVNYGKSLDDVKESIIRTCTLNNARAYVRLRKRNWIKTNGQMSRQLMNYVIDRQAVSTYDIVDSITDQYPADEKSYSLIDIDTKDENLVKQEVENLESLFGKDVVLAVLPTINGFHIITNTFRTDMYKSAGEKQWDVQTEQTLLYYA